MLFLSEKDVNQLVSMDDAVTAVEQALRGHGAETAQNAFRSRAALGDKTLNILGGSVADADSLGTKIYVTGGGSAKFWMMLFASDGSCEALLEADRLGQLRTGAASGVSAKALARTDSKVLGLVGAGYQAWTQAEAMIKVMSIEHVQVYSRTPEKREPFADQLRAEFSVAVEAVGSVEAATEGADVVVTMTSAADPLVTSLNPGTHYVFAGSNNPAKAEAGGEALASADVLVTDDRDQAKLESGTLRRAVDDGTIGWDAVQHLSDVLAGKTLGRTDEQQQTVFVSHGAGTWDVALARTVVDKAREQDIGTTLPFSGRPDEGRR